MKSSQHPNPDLRDPRPQDPPAGQLSECAKALAAMQVAWADRYAPHLRQPWFNR